MILTRSNWQLTGPLDAIIFDCDGTLSALEGIDELAKLNGAGAAVQQLTADAMGKTGINPELYQQRLALTQPTRDQVLALGEQYFNHQAPDVLAVIQLLQALNKAVYIISAGLYPAVAIFGKLLGVPQENIFAVNIYFDSAGNFSDFDHASPLVTADGKRTISSQLKQKHPRILHIGDGLNDYSTHDLVTRFVGYGGFFYRARIAELCQYYIATPSMTALLPLCLTVAEVKRLTEAQYRLYQQGLTLLAHGE